MRDWNLLLKPPNIFLFMGVGSFSVALYSTFSGSVSSRYRWIYRAKEPIGFWLVVAIYYLGSLLCFGCFFYDVYRPSE